MSNWIIYLLESSIVLAVFYAFYVLFLQKLTFFNLNRYYLLFAVVVSVLIPLVSFDFSVVPYEISNRPVKAMSEFRSGYFEALDDWVYEVQADSKNSGDFSTTQFSAYKPVMLWTVFAVYAIGLITVFSRTVWTYSWMHQLKKKHPKEVLDGVLVVKIPYPMPPFSFLNAAFLSEDAMKEESFDQILAHEKQHIKQYHSVDLLFVQLLAAFFWFNPIVWQLKKSLKITHEYIVDKHMMKEGYSLVAYQTLLLRQLISNNSYGLVHNFNLSFIKKRITMMKIEESGKSGIMKAITATALVIVTSLLIVQCNMMLEEQQQDAPMELPVISNTGNYKFTYDVKSSLTLQIANDGLFVQGKPVTLSELPDVLAKADLGQQGTIIIQSSADQKMGFVRKVHDILRKHDKRKVLYEAVTDQQEKLQIAMLLPPDPESNLGKEMPKITEAFIEENGLNVLWFQSGQKLGIDFQQQTYDFVKKQIKNESSKYVVSIKFDDADTYRDYLESFFYTSRAFDLLYDERAKELYGLSFYDIDRGTEEGNAQYRAARLGLPRAISIAEKD